MFNSYFSFSVRHIDYLKEPKSKCFLSQQLHDIVYEDSGATNIVAALEEARDVFKNARPNVNKVIFSVNFLFENCNIWAFFRDVTDPSTTFLWRFQIDGSHALYFKAFYFCPFLNKQKEWNKLKKALYSHQHYNYLKFL